jgi:hypothetical protein
VRLEDKDIYTLFANLAEKAEQDNEPLKEVFRILVKSTLAYRDNVLRASGSVVTVEDVQSALEWLLPALKTGRLPITDNKLRLDLLKLWLDELKIRTTPLH